MIIINFRIKGLKKFNINKRVNLNYNIIFFFEKFFKGFSLLKVNYLQSNNFSICKKFIKISFLNLLSLNEFFIYFQSILLNDFENIKDSGKKNLNKNFFYFQFYFYGLNKVWCLYFYEFLLFSKNYFCFNLFLVFCVFLKKLIFFYFEYIKSIGKKSA